MKITLTLLALAHLICITCSTLAFAQNDVEGFLRNAIKNINSNDIPSATKNLNNAGKLANNQNSWKDLLDIGYSFLALDKTDQSKKYFEDAGRLAKQSKDWRANIAVAYAFSSIGDTAKALSYFSDAGSMAEDSGHVYGMIESSKGLMLCDQNAEAFAILNDAKNIARDNKNIEELTDISLLFRKMNKNNAAKSCITIANDIKDTIKDLPYPPEGWQPYGESVAGPSRIPIEVQKANRKSADNAIVEKYQWIVEMKRQTLRQKEIALTYSPYYQSVPTTRYSYPGSSTLYSDTLRHYFIVHGLYHLLH